jgi:hypothetical protein
MRDDQPGARARPCGPHPRLIRRRSSPPPPARRTAVVAALERPACPSPRQRRRHRQPAETAHDGSVTEVTAGSGFAPHLDLLSGSGCPGCLPAARHALPGPGGTAHLWWLPAWRHRRGPRAHRALATGLTPTSTEGFGEVQPVSHRPRRTARFATDRGAATLRASFRALLASFTCARGRIGEVPSYRGLAELAASRGPAIFDLGTTRAATLTITP